MEREKIGNRADIELEEQGYICEEVVNRSNGQHDVLFTCADKKSKAIYAAWRQSTKHYPTEWFIGSIPMVELDGVDKEERLDIIARNCTIKVETGEVLGRLANLRDNNSFSLPETRS